MNAKSRILIGLDFSEMDNYLIHFLSNNFKILGSVEKLYFIYVEKDFKVPKELEKSSLIIPKDEAIQNKIREKLKIADADISSSDVLAVEGNPLKAILHWADVKNANLLVLGRKPEKDGSGIVAELLARKSNASILFVPQKEIQVGNIFVPVDFSEHSKLALEKAIIIADQLPDSTICCCHIYDVPSGYSKTGKTFKQASEIMKELAEKELKVFLKSFKNSNYKIESEVMLARKKDVAKTILSKAKQTKGDLIIMGSKGQTFASWVLLGSITEKIISINRNIPLLIVKKKDENIDFWKAVKRL